MGSIPESGRSPWRREWQPTPVFLPGKSHGQRNVVGYSPWGPRVRHNLATKQQQSVFVSLKGLLTMCFENKKSRGHLLATVTENSRSDLEAVSKHFSPIAQTMSSDPPSSLRISSSAHKSWLQTQTESVHLASPEALVLFAHNCKRKEIFFSFPAASIKILRFILIGLT